MIFFASVLETLEQVQSMQEGSIAYFDLDDGDRLVASKLDDSTWARTDVDLSVSDLDMIGWTALVETNIYDEL